MGRGRAGNGNCSPPQWSPRRRIPAWRGYSRNHRPDCKQVGIARIVNVEGLPLGYGFGCPGKSVLISSCTRRHKCLRITAATRLRSWLGQRLQSRTRAATARERWRHQFVRCVKLGKTGREAVSACGAVSPKMSLYY